MVHLATSLILASSTLLGFAVAGPVRQSREDLAVRALAHLLPRQGGAFITAPCANDGACASGCCAFNTGKCAGVVIALQRDGGCGFGNAEPNDDAARAIGFTGGITSPSNGVANAPNNDNDDAPAAAPAPASAPAADNDNDNAAPEPAASSGKAAGSQFITGPCANDGECASGCCGFNTGKCAGVIIALQRDGGCGFGDSTPNDDAARAQGFTGGITSESTGKAGGNNNNGNSAATDTAAEKTDDAPAASDSNGASSGNVQVANGEQAQQENEEFADITEDSDCTDGENACIGDAFAKCAFGAFVLMPCNTGLVCKSLPLVNSPGTSITCTTEADAETRIQTALSS